MRTVVRFCLVFALAVAAASAQTAPAASSSDNVAEQLKSLREALTAQQKQIAAQQQRIDDLTHQLQQRHATNLGEVASTSPMLPAAPAAPPAVPDTLQTPEMTKPEKAAHPSDSIVLANGKVKIGAVAYGDWGMYYEDGFGPQFVTQTNFPGPGNDGFNSFDITRAYLNFVYSPTDWLSFRMTPNLYRQVGGATAQKFGKVGGIGSSVNGNLTVRMKYAYAEFHHLFSGAFKDDNVRAGMQTNPLIDWEEGMYGYRFVNLVPWNYLSLSSTYTGLSLNGPIKVNGKQYLDYQIGVFNDSNFHGYEQAENKTVMARASFYPMGASSKYQGLGLTGFFDYGYNNATPDSVQTPVVRVAALGHYESAHNGAQIAFEYDFGRNAFSTGNMFSGGAPQDILGIGVTQYAGMSSLAKSVLAGRDTKQRGFDIFGHVNIPNSKYSVFGLYQYFQPNTNIPSNPLDFQRIVAGIAYRVNPHLRFAVDSQNVVYTHSQFTYSAADLATFDPTLAAANPNGIDNAVPNNVKAIFMNMEFSF